MRICISTSDYIPAVSFTTKRQGRAACTALGADTEHRRHLGRLYRACNKDHRAISCNVQGRCAPGSQYETGGDAGKKSGSTWTITDILISS